MKRLATTIFVLGAALANSHAAFAANATYTINIVGYVPVICNVQTDTTVTQPPSAGTVDLGNATEFCNNPNGYQVYVDYTPGVSGAYITVDETRIPLSASGTTLISASSTAGKHIHHLTLDMSGASQSLAAISMRAIAL